MSFKFKTALGLGASLSALILAAAVQAAPAPASAVDERAAEQFLDRHIDPKEMTGWLETMSSAPNHVGSPHDRANAEFMLAKFREWGWDAHIESFQVLYPMPISESLELVGPERFAATLTEPAIPGDRTSGLPGQLPAYVAYQGDGDVTAELVYVNYGMPEDYKALERRGVDVRGKIAIARYGEGWRGLKPQLAQEHGAVGCIIYSDPRDDGYFQDDVWPKRGMRPPTSFQRGSVQKITIHPGDPLTPGWGATAGARRLKRQDAETILKIPVLPISYGDAQHFLAALGGPLAPESFRGALPLTYHTGPGPARVRLQVRSDWSLKTIYDVVGVMKGAKYPDQWVMRGNHHDGWVFGAADPLSGNVALMAEAKAIGALAKTGWRPQRTLVYLGWDGEEPGLLGSTEWVETHAAELKAKGVLYINTDGVGRGYLNAEGSHSWQHLVNAAAADVSDPETGVSLLERERARALVADLAPDAKAEVHEQARRARANEDLVMGPLGSGSDYGAFIGHLGVGSLNLDMGGEAESGGVYHSTYDSFDHYTRIDDPGLAYSAATARLAGRVALRAAEAPIEPQRFSDFAERVATYLGELKTERSHMAETDAKQATVAAKGAWRLVSNPDYPVGPPAAETPVPALDFTPLDQAVERLKASAAAADVALSGAGERLSPQAQAQLTSALQSIEQTLLTPQGLPGRPWYQNSVYAPGVLTGYGAKTLPGVREAIESRRWDEAQRYITITARALGAYAERLNAVSRLARRTG